MGVDSAIAVAGLIAELGGVEGRKRLQKIVHLLQTSGASSFQYRFILHYFGPFSRELAGDVDFLCDAKLVEGDGPEDGEGSWKYSVDEAVRREIVEMCSEEERWAESVALAKKLNETDMGVLESLSTIVFLSGRREGDDLRQEFAKVKPRLDRCFDKAVRLGEELKLLTPQSGA